MTVSESGHARSLRDLSARDVLVYLPVGMAAKFAKTAIERSEEGKARLQGDLRNARVIGAFTSRAVEERLRSRLRSVSGRTQVRSAPIPERQSNGA